LGISPIIVGGCYLTGSCQKFAEVCGEIIYDFIEEEREKERCKKAKDECRKHCSDTTLPTGDRTSQGFPFFNCLNDCMKQKECEGQ
jgi:hypothetical protein